MIPKREDPKLITKYRPISLINYSFKLITKLITNILAKVIYFLINDTQIAFIKGRLILENIACAKEVLLHVKSKKIKGVLFKLYFEENFE